MSAQPMPPAYKHWLQDNGTPPLNFHASTWLRSGRHLLSQMRSLRNEMLEPNADWSLFDRWLGLRADFIAVQLWGEMIGPRSVRAEDYSRAAPRLEKSFYRLRRSSSRHPVVHVLRGWLRRINNPLTSAQKIALTGELDDWTHAKTSTALTPQDKLSKAFLRRENVYNDHCTSTPLVLNRRQVASLPKDLRAILRTNARLLGQRGWCVSAHTDEAGDCLRFLADESLREQLWRRRYPERTTSAAISDMLSVRQREAKEHGHGSYVAFMGTNSVMARPRKLLSWLGDASTELAKRPLPTDAIPGVSDARLPWNRHYVLSQRSRIKEPVNAFPLVATMDKVVVQMLQVGGWQVKGRQEHRMGQSRVWQFEANNAAGESVELWLAPFAPARSEGFSLATCSGIASEVRQGHYPSPESGSQRPVSKGIVTIALTVPPAAKHLSHDHLEKLVHELGHVLHYLAIDTGGYAGISDFPEDAAEFPSQLLAQVTCDPYWLASLSKTPAGRNPANWQGFLTQSWNELSAWQRNLISAQVDLACHIHPHPEKMDFMDVVRRIHQRHGMFLHDQDKSALNSFRFDAWGGVDYAYPLSMALAETFITARPDGTVDATALLADFGQLCRGLLRESTSIRIFRSAWKRRVGQSLEDSAVKGFKAWTNRMLTVSKA